MQVGGTILDHAEKWAAIVDDATSLRNIKMLLEHAVKEHQKVADRIENETIRAEFDAVFEDDIRRCNAMISVCSDRLEKEYRQNT